MPRDSARSHAARPWLVGGVLLTVGVLIGGSAVWLAERGSGDDAQASRTPTTGSPDPSSVPTAPVLTTTIPGGVEADPTDTVTPAPETLATDPRAETVGGSRAFVETFDGAPSAPTPFSDADWDIAVHSRDVATFDTLEPMQASHGPGCEGPPATHAVDEYPSTVFLCRDHMMTAITAEGYAMVYLTPDHMVDFADGEARITFDISTLRQSTHDWWDVWITPYDENLQLPLDLDVDVAGPPRDAVRIGLGTENQLYAEIWNDFELEQFPDWPETNVPGDMFTGYESLLEPDAARRDTVEIRISSDHLKIGMPAYDFWWVDSPIPELSWTSGVVQFGHHSYNPTKDCNESNTPRPPVANCEPNTWHWDNILIDPSVPFQIVHTDRRTATSSEPTLELEVSTPASGSLRFAGIGDQLEVRFDDGEWVPAVAQATAETPPAEHFASYWQPIPEGTRAVSFRGSDWPGGEWLVRDVAVWSADP